MNKYKIRVDDLIEGVEYFKSGDYSTRYKMRDGRLHFSLPGGDDWEETFTSYNIVKDMIFEEVNYCPKDDEQYFFPDITAIDLYGFRIWQNTDRDLHIKNTVGLFRTEEQAIGMSQAIIDLMMEEL